MDCSIGGQNSLSLSLSALLSTESAVVSCFNVKYSATRCLFTKNAKIDRKCQNQSFSPFFRGNGGNAFLQVWNMVWWIIMVFPVVVWRIFLLFCLDTLSWVRNYTFFVTRREDIKKEMMGVIEHKRYWQWCVSEKWKEKMFSNKLWSYNLVTLSHYFKILIFVQKIERSLSHMWFFC